MSDRILIVGKSDLQLMVQVTLVIISNTFMNWYHTSVMVCADAMSDLILTVDSRYLEVEGTL